MSPLSTTARVARSAIVTTLAHAGLGVHRTVDRPVPFSRLVSAVRDVHDAYRNHVLTELRDRDGRVELLAELRGTELSEAMYLLDSLQRAADVVRGDLVEMGVAQGKTSALLANEVVDSDEHLWLYDSFAGLSEPTDEDELIDDIEARGSMRDYGGAMAFPVEQVKTAVAATGISDDRVHVVPGFIHEALPPADLPATVAFAYIDFDLYEPILTGLRLLDPRTRAGSRIMVDDYRYFSSGVERAVGVFLSECPHYDLQVPGPAAGNFCVLVRQ